MLIPSTLPLRPNVYLRPVASDDADEMVRLISRNVEHLKPWMSWVHPYQPSSTALWVEAALRQVRQEQGAQFVVVRDGALAGTAGFHAVEWMNLATSIGYWLDVAAQGTGIMTAAVQALCGLAFNEWGLHRIQLRAAPDNVRSRAVAERCGFLEEGLARDAEYIAGRHRDLVLYSRLASDPASTTSS